MRKLHHDVLQYLLQEMGVNNRVYLSKSDKTRLAKQLFVYHLTVETALDKLAMLDLLTVEGGGVYYLNPYIFGKTDEENGSMRMAA